VRASALDVLAGLGGLLTYPDERYGGVLDPLRAAADDVDGVAAADVRAFAAWVGATPVTGLQEAFTQTFDLNPVCALEVGWQLFGEEYERGAFLVHARQLLREHGIAEGGELPDHLSSMLALLPRLPSGHANQMAADALVPAVGKMTAAIEGAPSPFRPLIRAIARLLAIATSRPEVAHA
jgi:nitrate reductase assembly molybdenum cofactor insertion protein NarJ